MDGGRYGQRQGIKKSARIWLTGVAHLCESTPVPNKRKKGKVHVGGYFEKQLVDSVTRLSKQTGLSRSALIERLILEGMASRGIKREGESDVR